MPPSMFHSRKNIWNSHYINSPFSGLLTSLKHEVPKVNSKNPKQYYVVCSYSLMPENTASIFNLFKTYMATSHNMGVKCETFLWKQNGSAFQSGVISI